MLISEMKINKNKKLILSGLVVVGVMSALITVTIAFFQDREESKGNLFQAGSIDIKLANTSYYNGELVEGASWQFADLDDQQGPYEGKYLFYNFNDLKPGDWGEGTLGLKVLTNESWLCADITVTENNENDITSQERRLQDTDVVGELANMIKFIWWTDDGDNVLEDDETVIRQSTLADVPTGIPAPIIFADATKNLWDANGGPLPGNMEKSIGSGWCYGDMTIAPRPQGENYPDGPVENSGFLCNGENVGDLSQSDSVKLDVLFYAVQARHNPDFVCPSLKYPLNVSTTGDGAGAVISDLTGIDCGEDCSEDYYRTQLVTLTANPAANSDFAGWGGACSGMGICQVTMDQAKSVQGAFSIKRFDLNVSRGGNGNGTINSSPEGINCGIDCVETYTYGTSVVLSAVSDPSSTFTGWSGACVGTGACIVDMFDYKEVTATFLLKSYTLSVNKSGTGSGLAVSDPAGISYPGDNTETYLHGTVVTLTATPLTNSNFVGWSGACAGTAPCVVTMDQVRTVTVNFALKTYALNVTKNGTGSGSVTSTPSGINCGPICSATYNHGTSVSLTPMADLYVTFAGWSGACAGTGLCFVTMDQAKNVTATFNKVQYTLTLNLPGASALGMVASNPAGINCRNDCSESYDVNTAVALTANTISGYVFTGWTGGCGGTSPTCMLTMFTNQTVNATYRNIVSVNPNQDAYVSLANSNTNYGSSTTLRVSSAWMGNNNDNHALVQFSLPNIGGKPIVNATLKFNFAYVNGYSGVTMYPIAQNWSELGVRYNNRPGLDSSVNKFFWVNTGTVSVDVTDWVQQMYGQGGSRPNYGFYLQTATGGDHGFYSREGGVRPVLEIMY